MDLKNTTLQNIATTPFQNIYNAFNQALGKALLSLLEDETITKKEWNDALRDSIKLQSKVDYEIMTKNNTPADHVFDTAILAYSIQEGFFTEDQLENILFEDGDTLQNFPERYSVSNIYDYLTDKLTNYQPIGSCDRCC